MDIVMQQFDFRTDKYWIIFSKLQRNIQNFPEYKGEGANPKGECANLLFWPFFAETAWYWEKLDQRGAGVPDLANEGNLNTFRETNENQEKLL